MGAWNSTIQEKYNKSPKRKLIGKRYIIESSGAYFHNLYTSVEDMETTESKLAWGPGMFHEDCKPKRSAEELFLYLDTPAKCKQFLAGKITKVRTGQLSESKGANKLFDSY